MIAVLAGCVRAPVEPAPPPAVEAGADAAAGELLRRWAPVFVQYDRDPDGARDRPTRIDFDGDWDTTNNWVNYDRYGSRLPAAVYGAAVLTETHAYLTYSLYYPRDWATPICLPYLCHENDLENVVVVVERGNLGGKLARVHTKAHLGFGGVTGAESAMLAGRPLMRVEAQGHGVKACRDGDPRCEPGAGRVLYAPEPLDDAAPYQLLSLRDTLWKRRHVAGDRLWAFGDTGLLAFDGSRLGRLGLAMGASLAGSRYRGGVRPPWGLKGPIGARGDWFLDPAHAAPADPDRGAGAQRYVYHPFLDDLRAECADDRCPPPPPALERARLEGWAGWGGLGLVLLVGMGATRARLGRHVRARRFGARIPWR